jgi:hypothetical protein
VQKNIIPGRHGPARKTPPLIGRDQSPGKLGSTPHDPDPSDKKTELVGANAVPGIFSITNKIIGSASRRDGGLSPASRQSTQPKQ